MYQYVHVDWVQVLPQYQVHESHNFQGFLQFVFPEDQSHLAI